MNATPRISADNYKYLQDLIYSGSGIVIEGDKHYLLEARLTMIVKEHGVDNINDLCALMRATGRQPVEKKVVEAMTTNETYFFREPSQYEAIKSTLLKELREQRAVTRKLSIWSAASSTGQEAYSTAMMLLEQGFAGWNVQILGTDLNEKVLERARAAKYLQLEVNRGLPAPLLLKYFRRQGLEWQLNDEVRRMARFEPLDLRQRMRALGPFDLVFCRNVLVYFDTPTRRKIIQEIHGTMFRGGWLLLGAAEVSTGMDEYFERRTIGNAIVYVAK